MQGQIGGVNGFVVIIFVHYILSDKVVLELKRQMWLAVASLRFKIAAVCNPYPGPVGAAEGCDLKR